MGQSLDWSRLRFTMDEGLARAVRVAFVRMYREGLIYRGERIINWCPRDTTALSDSEVEHEDVVGELVTFRYDLSDGSGHVDVATTRIETMLGDTGVAVHPDDDRYRGLVGKTVRHPLTGQYLPIVADDAVDPSFGTGPGPEATSRTRADREDRAAVHPPGRPLLSLSHRDRAGALRRAVVRGSRAPEGTCQAGRTGRTDRVLPRAMGPSIRPVVGRPAR